MCLHICFQIGLLRMFDAFLGAWWLILRLLRFEFMAVRAFNPMPLAAKHSLRLVYAALPVVALVFWPRNPALLEAFKQPAWMLSILIVLQFLITTFGFFLLLFPLAARFGIRERVYHYITVQNSLLLPLLLIALCFQNMNLYWPALVPVLEAVLTVFLFYISCLVAMGTLGLSPFAALMLGMIEFVFTSTTRYIMAIIIAVSQGG